MDYVQSTSANAQFVPIDKQPHLARIADAAVGLEQAIVLVQNFIERFCDQGSTVGGEHPPVPSGHLGQIERLGSAVAKMDKLARELGTIG